MFMRQGYAKIGKRVRAIRKQKGLSQGQLGEMVGVGASHLSHLEHGKTKISVKLLINICNALDISSDELLGDYINKVNEAPPRPKAQ